MRRTIHIHPDALREIYSISRGVVTDLTSAIRVLEENPAPDNSLPAQGRPGRYDLRAGGYIIVYEISEEKITVLVVQQD